ncbi:MAG: hypothetical protein U0401_29760 [Anaerolineae bacterium]
MRYSVAEAVVNRLEGGGDSLGDDQAVGGVEGVGQAAGAQEVAVGVKVKIRSVGNAIQPVGGVVLIFS